MKLYAVFIQGTVKYPDYYCETQDEAFEIAKYLVEHKVHRQADVSVAPVETVTLADVKANHEELVENRRKLETGMTFKLSELAGK